MPWSNSTIVAGLVLILAISFLMTVILYHYALKKKLFDIPNNRSSHTVPTPRGGGLAIAIGIFLGSALLGHFRVIPVAFVLAIVGGGVMIVSVGLVDDRFSIPAQYRIIVHGIAAAWALTMLGGLPVVHTGLGTVSLGVWGSFIGLIGIVAMSNLYNFMDGIDGLAASEAVVVGLIGGLLLLYVGAQSWSLVGFLIAASSAGFLTWNWHPAKIFMGDGGSVLLGYCFAVLAIATEQFVGFSLLIWVLLLAVFIVDALLSTLRRILKGERWFEAHRTFAYQRAVERGYSHADVVRRVIGFNFVLAVLAASTVWKPILILPALFFSLFVLSFFWFFIQTRTFVRDIS